MILHLYRIDCIMYTITKNEKYTINDREDIQIKSVQRKIFCILCKNQKI